jgi:hypothetical protein
MKIFRFIAIAFLGITFFATNGNAQVLSQAYLQSLTPSQAQAALQNLSPAQLQSTLQGLSSSALNQVVGGLPSPSSVLGLLPTGGLQSIAGNFSPASLQNLVPNLSPQVLQNLVPGLSSGTLQTLVPNLSPSTLQSFLPAIPTANLQALIPTLSTPQLGNVLQGLSAVPGNLQNVLSGFSPAQVQNMLGSIGPAALGNVMQGLSLDPTALTGLLGGLSPTSVGNLLNGLAPDVLGNVMQNLSLNPAALGNLLTSLPTAQLQNLLTNIPIGSLQNMLGSLSPAQLTSLSNLLPANFLNNLLPGGIGNLISGFGGGNAVPDPISWDFVQACSGNGAAFSFSPLCLPCGYYTFGQVATEWSWPLGQLGPGLGSMAGTYPRLKQHLVTEFTAQKIWMATIFWEDNVLPALMLMAEQLSAVAMQQAQIVGSFLDAKHQMETQQVFQRLMAQAHKDYQPSIGVCEFGSAAKSLAASERKAELNQLVLARRSQDRSLGNANTSAALGEDADKDSRIKQFREKFCDPWDNNNGLTFLCDHDQNFASGTIGAAAPGGIGAPSDKKERMNKDIDFVRTIDSPWTINADFSNTSTATDNEEEILALASNLYGHEVFFRPPAKSLESSGSRINAVQKAYMDMRAVIAKRSVAENSFNAITAMKTEGMPGSRDYLVELLKQLDVQPTGDINKILGANPSYWAQMEILTKKIYQNPDFYTNLYDKPANVDRKGLAIQAIGLMQKFDLYKSNLRNESTLSVLLELAVQDLQNEIENQFNAVRGGGNRATP